MVSINPAEIAKLAALPANGIKLSSGSRPNRKLVPGKVNWLSIKVEMLSIQRNLGSGVGGGVWFMFIGAENWFIRYAYAKQKMAINF